MGFDDGRIVFERPDDTFSTGDTVRGKLVFHQEKPKTFRGIYVKFKGYCNVHWTTSHTRTVSGPNNTTRTEHYTKQHNSHEEYFNHKHYLIGRDSGDYHLQPGNHEFPFEMLIPQDCPSSYEGDYGQIRYELKCVVDRAMKFDQEKSVNLNVVATRDLNEDPYCREPIPFEFYETYCCFCCKSGACEVTVRLPAAGYCPGQTIPIEVSVDNQSNVKIETIKLEINEETVYIADHEPDTREEKNVVAKIKKGPIDANTSREWTLEMEVPVMDIRNVDACNYINVDYEFEVTICPEGCHTNSEKSAPLVLGHIPLREFEGGSPQQEQSQGSNAPYVANNTSYPGGNQPYPDAQPPYPGSQPGYPGAQPGYPGAYPPQDGGFHAPNSTYPGGNPPYPGPNPPFPGGNPPFPGGNPPYPGPNPPFPGGNPPYPGPNPPFPGGNPPFPGGNPPYPGPNPPYPGGNPPYPGGNPPYTGPNPPFPGGNPPYPGPNPPFPGGNPPFPGGNPPYPGPNPPYPGGNPPYPGGNPPYTGPNPPFPGANSPYPPYPGVNSPYSAPYAASNDEKPTMPLLPQGAGVPYPPAPTFSMASAPEP